MLPLDVVYASDRGGFGGLLISMVSLTRALQRPSSCILNVIAPAAERNESRKLIACYRANIQSSSMKPATVRVHALKSIPFQPHIKPVGTRRDMLSASTFVRMYLHHYAIGGERVLYLDVDTLIRADVSHFFAVARKPFAATSCPACTPASEHREMSLRGWKSLHGAHIFSNAVMLINLSWWAASGIVDAWEHALEGPAAGMDMLALNLAVWEQGLTSELELLDPRWDMGCAATGELPVRAAESAFLLHYTCGHKPYWAGRPVRSKVQDYLLRQCGPQHQCSATWIPDVDLLAADPKSTSRH